MSEEDGICAIVPSGHDGFRPQVLGMGILVGDRDIVTCAHVIDVALGYGWHQSSSAMATVRACFPFVGICCDGTVDRQRWFSSGRTRGCEPSDIAVIELAQ